jgi:RNA polymerase sigma-70 factor (ECF subfamily)
MGAEDVDRFRALATAELPRLYAVARRLVGAEAEDAVQDCLLKAFRAYPGLKNAGAGPAWLVTVLVNCCRDRGRRNARRMEDSADEEELDRFSLYRKIAAEDPFPYSDSLHLDFLAQFSAEDVRAVLLSLPLLYRAPLVLVHMEGFSTKEVATMLGAPIGTVLARLHRGRKLFELRLWDYADEHALLRTEVVR